MELEIAGRRHPMIQTRHGWWKAEVPGLPEEVDYAYRIDGHSPLPDPRSPWQPHGVHGPSRTIDHARFHWRDAGFQAKPLASAIIYELHVGTFSAEGTFAGAITKLDHLVRLGVTHIELMPVASWDGPRGWGYDGVSLFAPHASYGGPNGLKQLVSACHERGLAVLLDVVYNHLGPSGNYLPQFGAYFTERHHTDWGWAVNFDGAGSDEVRRYVLDNITMWLRDYHIDGLRLDAVHAIVDTSARHILEEIADHVRSLEAELGRHLVVIAESDLNDPRLVRPIEAGGYGLDAHWSDDIHHTIHAVLTAESTGYYRDFGRLEHLAAILKAPYLYAGHYSEHRKRLHGRDPSGLPGRRFVACIQNHDQVGNRPQGERLCHLVGLQRAKLGAGLLLTSAYVPLLFQGEEWAASSPFQYFTSFADAELGHAVTEGRRREGRFLGWKPEQVPDPQDLATFERSQLNWVELELPPHAEMLRWYRQLIALRKSTTWLADGHLNRVVTSFDEEAGWLRVERGPGTIVTNLNDRPARVPLAPNRARSVLLTSDDAVSVHEDAVVLPRNALTVLGPTHPLSLSDQACHPR
jgi:maltooligosyltrehalose trehalohydrolase